MKSLIAIGLALSLTGCTQALNKPQDGTLPQGPQTQTETLVSPAPETDAPTQEPSAEQTEEPVVEQTTEPTTEPTPEPTEEPPAIAVPKSMDPPYNLPFGDPYDDAGNLSNETLSWYFNRNPDHQPPTGVYNFDSREFDGYYLGDTSRKAVYLTFDHGYENGFTESILDTLKEKNVTAAHFVVQTYIRDNPDIVKRMVDEGQLVVNHSVTHPSFPTISDEDIAYELNETARYFNEITGQDMPKFFRPPAGEFSARTLARTQELGYKTIFWSFAYKDWLVDEQPGKDYAYKMVMDNLHNGSIMLLHAVSRSNMEALPDIIDGIRAQGYEFSTLHDFE